MRKSEGKLNYLSAYLPEVATQGYSEKNKFELPAYKFGGDGSRVNIPVSKQILKKQNIWWQ